MYGIDQMTGGQEVPSSSDTLGNHQVAPRRAIDRLLMTQQQQQPRGSAMAFPMGIPQNEQPPQPQASSFMTAMLGQQPVR